MHPALCFWYLLHGGVFIRIWGAVLGAPHHAMDQEQQSLSTQTSKGTKTIPCFLCKATTLPSCDLSNRWHGSYMGLLQTPSTAKMGTERWTSHLTMQKVFPEGQVLILTCAILCSQEGPPFEQSHIFLSCKMEIKARHALLSQDWMG